jgi:hypothetical protein
MATGGTAGLTRWRTAIDKACPPLPRQQRQEGAQRQSQKWYWPAQRGGAATLCTATVGQDNGRYGCKKDLGSRLSDGWGT